MTASTGVLADRERGRYCGPSCVGDRGEPFPSDAAAQAAGFLACTACPADPFAGPTLGPSRGPGRDDLATRVLDLLEDGAFEREGTAGLGARLGVPARRMDDALRDRLGVGLLALARARRVRTARLLLEGTTLTVADAAAAAGFRDARELGAALSSVTGLTPSQLRRRTAEHRAGPWTAVTVRLAFRPPLLPDSLFGHLAATAVPGVEEWRSGAYRRTLRLPRGPGVVALAPRPDHVECRLWLRDRRALTPALARCRRLLDLDADPVRIDAVLAADPVLARVLALGRGRRVPRAPDGPELAVRAVLGQQVSTAAARTHAARLVRAHGEAVDDPDGGLTHLFPDTAALAGLDPSSLALPRARRRTMAALLAALTGGPEQEGLDLDVGADPARARAALTALPGFGPWTVETILMRALGDDDAFLPTDLGVAAAASRLGLPPTPAALRRYAERWRPWRAYAVQYLWATGEHAVNRLPPADVVLSPS